MQLTLRVVRKCRTTFPAKSGMTFAVPFSYNFGTFHSASRMIV